MKKKFILGVSGCIGSGKSTALDILEKNGWFVIDSDKIVHDLYMPDGLGQRKILDFFGDEFLLKNGSVNRAKLKKAVFCDAKKLRILNSLIHPLVFTKIVEILDKTDALKIALEAAYFDKSFLGKLINKLIFIERPSFDAGVCVPIDYLPKKYDLKIVNNSTLKEFAKKVIIAVDKLVE